MPFRNSVYNLKFIHQQLKAFVIVLTFLGLNATVFAQVTPSFKVSKVEGCVPLIVDFENTTPLSESQMSVRWNFGNGNQSTEKIKTQAAYTEAGNYHVVMTVQYQGVEYEHSQNIMVHDIPEVGFVSNTQSGCVPLELTFQDQSVSKNKIVDWTWNFGDGSGSILQNPKKTYQVASESNVTLVVTDEKGCKNSLVKSKYIIATEKPIVDFTYSNTVSCKLPISVQFQEEVSSNYLYSRSWIFNQSESSIQSKPSKIYEKAGDYEVSLHVENEYGCKEKKSQIISIQEKPLGLKILTDALEGCAPFILEYDYSSNFPIENVRWELNGQKLEDSLQSYVFESAGVYELKLQGGDDSGCEDVLVQEVVVKEGVEADFEMSESESCKPPLEVNFKSLTKGSDINHQWIIGQIGDVLHGDVQSYQFDNYGVYDITYIAQKANGCADTLHLEDAVMVADPFVQIIATKDEGCVPFNTELELVKLGPGEIKNIQWIFPDGSTKSGSDGLVQYSITEKGSHDFIAIIDFEDINCAQQIAYTTIRGGEKHGVDAYVSPLEVCVGDGVSGDITNPQTGVEYAWHMGDGSIIEKNKLAYEYSDPGFWGVFIETNSLGCRDSIHIDSIEVLNPSANFTVAKSCENGIFNFTNRSVGSTYTRWDFGDGTIIESQDNKLSYEYASLGNYQVKLYVFNENTLCEDSMTVEVQYEVFNEVVDFDEQVGCLPFVAEFSVDSDRYKSLSWMIDNSIEYTNEHISHEFKKPGKYDLKLVATRKDGCKEEYFYPEIIKVSQIQSDFEFDPIGGCAPITVNFQDLSISDSSDINSWEWIIDGQSIDDINPSLTFNQNRDIEAILVVGNEIGCVDTLSQTVPIYIPEADFTSVYASICTDADYFFENKSIGVGLVYEWEFEGVNDSFSDLEHPVVQYKEEGDYSAKLIITDANNCVDSISKSSFVKVENIQYDFDASPRFKTCPELVSTFEVFPSNMDYNHLEWSFGDGNYSLDTNLVPVNIYSESGVFDVGLILEDYRGCKDTLSKKEFIEVKGPRGSLNFTPKVGCVPFEVELSAEFVDSKFNFWDFGDGVGWLDENLETETKHIYTESGKVYPSLVLDDGYGCLVTLTYDSLTVHGVLAQIDMSRSDVCSGGEIEFFDISKPNLSDPIINRFWEFSNGVEIQGERVAQSFDTHNDQETKVYLKVQTETGCEHTDTLIFKVHAYPEISVPEELIICKGDAVQLQASGAKHYSWEEKRYLSDEHDYYPMVQPIKDTWFTVHAYDTSACVTTDSVFVKVIESFEAHTGPDAIICNGDTIQMETYVSDVHSGSYIYSWLVEGVEVSSEKSPTFKPQSDQAYILNVKNGSCKEQRLPVFVRTLEAPELTVYRDTTIALGQSVTLNATSDSEVNYEWQQMDHISCVNCPNPTVNPLESTLYSVVATNEAGCYTMGEVLVEVINFCGNAKIEIPNVFTPNNDGLNDVFRIRYDRDKVDLDILRIYNRYGELIFETQNVDQGWDGNFSGDLVNSGVYVYYLVADCYDGTSKIIKGNVTLLR